LWWNVPTSLPVCFRWSILKPDTTEVLLDSPSSHVLNLQWRSLTTVGYAVHNGA